ncbi:hypothetical protein R1sor_005916 [Riccia sorocarpa]|uniref:Uncharacterized protein n=1 Tax=Riccia sorocarpa TaxID=122646 RepID=A0ABD3HKX2_9MARC
MDFLKQAASLAQNSKSDESESKSGGGGGIDFNSMSSLMSNAQGFLAHNDEKKKKPETEASESGGGGFDFNKMSNLMSTAQGFLGENDAKKKTATAGSESGGGGGLDINKVGNLLSGAQALGLLSGNDGKKKQETASKIPEPVLENKHASEDEKLDAQEKPPADHSNTTTTTSGSHTKPSYPELYGNAQTLYSGLRGKLEGKKDIDDEKLKGAAEDLLKGAESLGLLKPDNPYSGYFKKAEGFLHNSGSQPHDSEQKKDSRDGRAPVIILYSPANSGGESNIQNCFLSYVGNLSDCLVKGFVITRLEVIP